jgi:hypothetical protein
MYSPRQLQHVFNDRQPCMATRASAFQRGVGRRVTPAKAHQESHNASDHRLRSHQGTAS